MVKTRTHDFYANLGSIRPYLVAARKWYSEADAGPGAEAGAEAGAGFRG